MADMEGMNVKAVEDAGRRLKNQAAQIGAIKTRVGTSVSSAKANWEGQDASRFVEEWEGTHRQRLTDLEEALRRLGTEAITQAQQQARVSNS
jgi:uncharacterized protein YukE